MRQPTRAPAMATRAAAAFLLVLLWAGPGIAAAQSKLAPGFQTMPPKARIVVMPTDIELYSISAGGIPEPKADWTDAASRHFRAALQKHKRSLGVESVELSERDADDFAEANALHAAIARAIAMHHFGPSLLHLPTKDGKLDWSLGEAVAPIKQKTGADYALFSWIRDSYASGERVATMIGLALLGIYVPGGVQIGYASLVELDTGRVLWFNRLVRQTGDLREAEKAEETVARLLSDFPGAK